MKMPLSSVVVTLLNSEVAFEVTVTVTLATGFPCGSTTLPTSRPCRAARTCPVVASTMARTQAVRRCSLIILAAFRSRLRRFRVYRFGLAYDRGGGRDMRSVTITALACAAAVLSGDGRANAQSPTDRVCIKRREINAISALDGRHALARLGAGRL